jgi:hypothetical protein
MIDPTCDGELMASSGAKRLRGNTQCRESSLPGRGFYCSAYTSRKACSPSSISERHSQIHQGCVSCGLLRPPWASLCRSASRPDLGKLRHRTAKAVAIERSSNLDAACEEAARCGERHQARQSSSYSPGQRSSVRTCGGVYQGSC